jgi:hypothetical protein
MKIIEADAQKKTTTAYESAVAVEERFPCPKAGLG